MNSKLDLLVSYLPAAGGTNSPLSIVLRLHAGFSHHNSRITSELFDGSGRCVCVCVLYVCVLANHHKLKAPELASTSQNAGDSMNDTLYCFIMI